MKEKSTKEASSDEMRPEYKRKDFGVGVRGKYYKAYQEGTNLVLLNPDRKSVV